MKVTISNRFVLISIWISIAIPQYAIPQYAIAQEMPKPSDQIPIHEKLLKMALENIHRAKCGAKKLCAPATKAERMSPPITNEQAKKVVSAAVISVIAKHCGLDWQQRNFLPMMKYHRENFQMAARQTALIGLLHGITMGMMKKSIEKKACTPSLKLKAEKGMFIK